MSDGEGTSSPASGAGTEPPAEPKGETQQVAALELQAQALLHMIRGVADDVTALRARIDDDAKLVAETLAKVREEAQSVNDHADASKNAGEEASRLVEELRTSTAAAKEAWDALKAQIDPVTASAESARASAETASAAHTEVLKLAEEARTKSQHIEDGRQFVETSKKQIEGYAKEAAESAKAAEQQEASAAQTREKVEEILASSKEAEGRIKQIATTLAELKGQAETHTAQAKNLADIAARTEASIEEYEKELKRLMGEAQDRLDKIKELLPGATSAGLAFAFRKRRRGFLIPHWLWQIGFIGAVSGLIVLAFTEFNLTNSDAPPAIEAVYRSLLLRLPLIVPLVWFALYAARQAALAMHLEEDYAYKEVISQAFEGYKKQLGDIGAELPTDAPLRVLCDNTLRALAAPPGRIYEKHRPDVTPWNSAAESVQKFAGARAK